jgi:hypothetical protein
MMLYEKSKEICKEYTTTDPIHLFLQFYIDKDKSHFEEIQFALKKNVENPYIDSIIMLNERIYSDDELGVSHSKIKQVVIHNRITYSDFLKYKIKGYKVLINSDIFVDETIQHVKKSDIHICKKMVALLRYEYNNNQPYLFCSEKNPNGRPDSQDTWIIHSNHTFSDKEYAIFNLQLGIPGCDNKICYLFSILGYEIYNDPVYIKSYHCHIKSERNYKGRIEPPYCYIFPFSTTIHPIEMFPSFKTSNSILYNMLKKNNLILVPRIAGIENNCMLPNIKLNVVLPVMKRNAGIAITSEKSLQIYREWYLSAFEKCSVYAVWEPWGNYMPHISESHQMITNKYKRPHIFASVFDIFHYIYKTPWTHALAGKRILIISSFIDSIQTQKQAYPIDLFPGCSFVYLKPPQTNGANPSQDWVIEFTQFCKEIKKIENEFDVALCACGGYGNPVCSYIYSLNKSAIYVGGVLQMYFGIYGKRWLKERKDVINLFMTPSWKRPNENEKPLNHTSIENGCYW